MTIGVFDGVHRGHQATLAALRAWAVEPLPDPASGSAGDRGDAGSPGASGAPVDPVVLTFERHPREVLTGQGPPLLTSLEHRLLLLERQSVAGTVVLPFDREVASWSAEEFVQRVLVDGLNASRVLVGSDHRFGRGRAGDVDLLRRLGAAASPPFEARALDLEDMDGQVISSTAIRQAVREARLDDAARLLGRPVGVLGDVVQGDQRGRLLGFPTANLDLHHEARPPRGVYAARARTIAPDGHEGPLLPAVVNIGRRPTFHPEAGEDLVEVHLLDEGPHDLYGQRLEVLFVAHLRDEQRFPGPDALREQIQRDCARAREALGATPKAS